MTRIEKDFFGEMEVPHGALYGISALRSSINFPHQRPFSKKWYQSLGTTKKAVYLTLKDLLLLLRDQKIESPFGHIAPEKIDALIAAADEVAQGMHYDHFIVPAVSGGAGTSINMNINEIIANRALELSGTYPGNYAEIDPTLHANIFQSTNDVVPTSLRVAVLTLLADLEKSIAQLRNSLEALEKEHRHHVRMAYTQLQEAVPSTWGRLFSTYSEALSRDWWRISKCWERIKVVNLGGGAIGSGIAVPRYYIFHVNDTLAKLTGLPLVRAENLQDATANLDAWVEIHGMLKALAVNLIKMVSDLRLLASDFHQAHELSIPALQKGSSIMPGKINPVMPEYVISLSEKVLANDFLITHLCSQGQLDLNAYLPLIGDSFLESLEMLLASTSSANAHLIKGISINPSSSRTMRSPCIVTALIPEIGYHEAEKLALYMKQKNIDIETANNDLKTIPPAKLSDILKTENLLQLGYSLRSKVTHAQ